MASHPSEWALGGEKEDLPYGTKEKTAGRRQSGWGSWEGLISSPWAPDPISRNEANLGQNKPGSKHQRKNFRKQQHKFCHLFLSSVVFGTFFAQKQSTT